MIKAVIFDMDGLLIDSEPLWRRAQVRAFESAGIDAITEAEFHNTKGIGVINAVKQWHHLKPWRQPSQQEVVKLIVEELLQLIEEEGRLLPGVLETLDLCRRESLPMALASSSAYRVIDKVVDGMAIRDYFKVIYSGEDEEHNKPHPGVFISTAKRLETEPRNCLVFEDSPSGVLAAKAARMKCVAVPIPLEKNHPFIKTADIVLDSLKEFDEAALVGLQQ
ncbi:MAG TPA: hexitol phosphatase HxpB [Candidatus Dormibacteraeota bacterium]|nr:hexitol phosphatase HxpB [Candidatus Dormibacteraeota bacterium]